MAILKWLFSLNGGSGHGLAPWLPPFLVWPTGSGQPVVLKGQQTGYRGQGFPLLLSFGYLLYIES